MREQEQSNREGEEEREGEKERRRGRERWKGRREGGRKISTFQHCKEEAKVFWLTHGQK